MKQIILSFLLILASTSFAQRDSIYNMNLEDLLNVEIDVSSTKSENVFKTPSTVTVVDASMIRRYNFLSVAEAVRIVAGLDIYQSNIDVNIPTSRGILQNYYANKILIMINNIPTWQPVYGNGSLDRVDINDIERIEVLKGPASVLYGTNAYTGVINLVLKNKGEEGIQAKAQFGHPSIGSGGVNVNTSKGNWKVFASANSSYEKRAPYTIQNDNSGIYNGNTTYQYNEEQRQTSSNLIIDYKGFSIFANSFTHQYIFPGINLSYSSGGGGSITDRGIQTGFRYDNNISDKLQMNAFVTYDYFDREWPVNADKTMALFLTSERIQGSLKLNYNITDDFNIEIGTDGERGSGVHKVINLQNNTDIRQNMDDSKEIVNWSAFAQLRYQVNSFSLLAGSRLVNNNIFGNNISSRITGVYSINETNSIKAIWGQAYRAPSMLELYFDHPTVVGNSHLEPELSTSYELAYVSKVNDFFVQAIAYRSSYTNMIQRFTPEAGPPSEYDNTGEFEAWGTEIELKYQNPDVLNVFVNYNFMAGITDKSEANFNLVPSHSVSYGITKPFRSFSVGLNGFVVSGVKGILKDINPQHFIDAHLSYNHNIKGARIQHTLSGKNLPGGPMLSPQYIRKSENINTLETMGYGTRFIYSLRVNF